MSTIAKKIGQLNADSVTFLFNGVRILSEKDTPRGVGASPGLMNYRIIINIKPKIKKEKQNDTNVDADADAETLQGQANRHKAAEEHKQETETETEADVPVVTPKPIDLID